MSNSCEPSSVCPGCGRAFACGMMAGEPRCWCAELPPLKALPDAGKACYCPECLEKMLADESVKPA